MPVLELVIKEIAIFQLLSPFFLACLSTQGLFSTDNGHFSDLTVYLNTTKRQDKLPVSTEVD